MTEPSTGGRIQLWRAREPESCDTCHNPIWAGQPMGMTAHGYVTCERCLQR